MNMWLKTEYGSVMYLDNGLVVEAIRNYAPGRTVSGFEYTISTAGDGLLIESWENYSTLMEAQRQALARVAEVFSGGVAQ